MHYRQFDHDSMEKPTSALFDVFLRLRPSRGRAERFLNVESDGDSVPTHVTVHPPSGDNRKRAIERFAFTQIFEESAGQIELFQSTGIPETIQNVLGSPGHEGRDGIVATLGVTGSGKVRSSNIYGLLVADSCTEPHYTRLKD